MNLNNKEVKDMKVKFETVEFQMTAMTEAVDQKITRIRAELEL